MNQSQTLTRWCQQTPIAEGFDLNLWNEERLYPVVKYAMVKARTRVMFSTIASREDIICIRTLGWPTGEAPRGWYRRKHANGLYMALIEDGFKMEAH